MKTYVVITGENRCFGPFGSIEAAEVWAENRFDDEEDWEVSELEPSVDED